MNRLFVASGPEGLVEAADALQSSDRYDMAAVNDVLQPDNPLLEELDNSDRSKDDENTKRLHEELPELDVIHGLVAAMWATKGYKGMHLTSGFYLDLWRSSSFPAHIDTLKRNDSNRIRRIEAGFQLSLCLKGLREFKSERLDDTFYTGDDRFDQRGYERFESTLLTEILNGRTPRTAAEIKPGALAMFPHHPVVSLHQAINLQPGSLTRLISYNAEADPVAWDQYSPHG